jgi:hypothetical protein
VNNKIRDAVAIALLNAGVSPEEMGISEISSAAIAAYLAALDAAGWKVVPRKPTDAMDEAGWDTEFVALETGGSASKIWQAMIDAAPEPPK